MRHIKSKPPRRPRAKAADRHHHRAVALDGAYGTLLGLLAVLVLARLLVAACAAVPPVASVGDRVQVSAAAPIAVPDVVLPARGVASAFTKPGPACTLNITAMKQPGGVLSVVAVRPDGVVLSWAGGATAAGAQNCQMNDPEILLAQNDYAVLLNNRSKKH
jgi:hypothetical protein